MTRFLSCIKSVLVVASLGMASIAEAAEPCDMGVLVPGEMYSFPAYTEVRGEYTPSQTGPVKFLYSCSPIQLYYDKSCSEESIVDGSHSFVDGSQMISYSELEAGHTYYLYSAMTMMGGTLKITEGTAQLEVISVNPSLGEGEFFSVSSHYTIDVAFNMPVTVGRTLLLAGGESYQITSSVSNSYVTCDVAGTVMGMYRQGLIKEGDVMTLRILQVADASDANNKYDLTGKFECDFVMAEKPAELVEIINASQSTTENPFLSYYLTGDESGMVTFVFDRPLLNEHAVAKLTYGNTDNMDVGVYQENVAGAIEGYNAVFDFTGKLRRPIDMLPASTETTQPSNLHILFADIYSEDGQRVYTARQSNPSGFSMSFNLTTLQYTISTDFTPGRGSQLIPGKEMEIWVMNGSMIRTSGIKVGYVKDGSPVELIIPISEVRVEQDPVVADDMIYTFNIPDVDADPDTKMTISFADVVCGDGLDHSKELSAEFGYATSGVEGIVDSANESYTVYDVTGLCVLRNGSQNDVKSLPRGLYIVNGKKTVVK